MAAYALSSFPTTPFSMHPSPLPRRTLPIRGAISPNASNPLLMERPISRNSTFVSQDTFLGGGVSTREVVPPFSNVDVVRSTNVRERIQEPKFGVTVSELLEKSGVLPISVYGDLDAHITGIKNDSRKVISGDLFVCCVGKKNDGHMYIGDAIKRGAVALVVSNRWIKADELLGFCRSIIILEDTSSLLPVLAASFFHNPSKMMSVIGITGTNGKTTTAYLVKSIYETMGLRTGMLGTVGYCTHGADMVEAPNTTPDAVMVQELMAKMVHNGAKTVVMEASSHGLALGRCDEVDFDVAVFTNLTRDHYDFHGTEEEYRNTKGKLFAKMVNPRRHRKVVNIDDPSALFFLRQGSKDVPVVTFAMENKDADVYPLMFEHTMSGTHALIITPKGVLEISSGLLGRHNIFNILAAVSVGIAVGAKLEDITIGIEGMDGIPGRCELIDEGQPFAVMVDFAHSPDALSRILDTASELVARKVITVFGCAGESDRGKRPVMTKIAADKSDVVILTTDNPKTENPFDILDDMLAGVGWNMEDYVRYSEHSSCPFLPNGHRLFVHNIRRVAVRAAVAMAQKGDIVVLAGRGHETYQLEGDKKVHFDDREECREALQHVEKLHRAAIDKRIPSLLDRSGRGQLHDLAVAFPLEVKL